MNLLLFAALLAPVAQAAERPVVIGTHYTDALAGLAVYRDAKESVVLDFGWVSKDGKQHRGYKALVDAKVHFGEAAPDDSYHRISWTVDTSTITYEWGLVAPGVAVGIVSTTGQQEIEPRFFKGWSQASFQEAAVQNDTVLAVGDLTVRFKAVGGPSLIDQSHSYLTTPSAPLQFSIGTGKLVDPRKARDFLDAARKKYDAGRLWAEGDWGNFVSPFENQLGNTKIYSADTGRLAHIVSRGWCLPDGQVLFCWDSFFNGLMSSLEDPKGARQTLRAILAETTKEGFVPNYAGRGWGVSVDRSQPPVGSYCIWRIHQRDPDLAFLKEAYPKLLKWHKWWFSSSGKGAKPTRDGNGDGLLEWGTTTGDLQNAKYESGLDDSPMFDDGKMFGPNMDLDSTDLSALWAMDADYLSRIADAIGKYDDAHNFRSEKKSMAQRMDRLLWNDALGAYCYRYWTPKTPTEEFSPRLSPLNFYPLMVDSPSQQRARRTLDLFFRPDQFGGQYVCPTISKSDSAYPAQGYWRGTIWGPTSYLTFQGLRRFATSSEMTDYAAKSVALFMKNWNEDGSCHENFNSITGWGRSDPHYTWGALLCLIGLEQLCDLDDAGRVVLNGASGLHIKIHNLRLAGRLYDLTVEPKKAILNLGGRQVAVAGGKVLHLRL